MKKSQERTAHLEGSYFVFIWANSQVAIHSNESQSEKGRLETDFWGVLGPVPPNVGAKVDDLYEGFPLKIN